ncbi:MAG: TauD/TfdA family dioxygenase [SAR86 cluster bacterium]|uniref:24-dichlorophenoxyacetate alpha-ketoglutarate dioxygenase n=1 Tax=uncultured marine bacterium EB0_39H12 TaxID=415437 RepID=A4GHS2_9BACT|nr:24-dichlorophenoxyacetate alpha-ketoglutarate dioxygenase [uncultured marine bacterium EB0_39H12]MDG1120033.1 TauD/TfdA family dioxygenase [SAR86 cluster bacterium]MDG1229529.1 TauD/TfdA family dioxygenase [SAR86 cluster bacterium]MDG1680871.1 TauD/TfdA family dioxygenase [SAR86 cluster bacterium]
MRVEPLKRSFGAKVYDLSLPDLNTEQAQDVYDLWLKYALLIFPGQHLSNDQQIKFAKNFGALEFDLSPISNVRNDGSIRDANDDDIVKSLRGNMEWHHDSTYMPIQAKGAVFTAHKVPSHGGETGWADMRAAYEALDQSMKDKINELSAYHSYEWSQKERFGHKDPKVSEFNSYGFDIDPKPLRPLVKTHNETGQKCLTIGRHINKIPGLSDQEAQNLAKELEEYACSNKEWVYHHAWEVGDAVIWDNRCLMHQASMWDLSEGRIMYHSRIEGDPIAEAASNYL